MTKRYQKPKQPVSARRYLTFYISIIVIPLSLFLLIYNISSIRSVRSVNNNIADAGQSVLTLMQTVNELELNKLATTLSYDWASEINHLNLISKTDPLSRNYALNQIGKGYRNLITQSGYATILALYSASNDCTRVWSEDGRYTYQEYDAIKQRIGEILSRQAIAIQPGWTPLQIGENHFVAKVVGYPSACTVVLADMDKVCQAQNNSDRESGGVVGYFQPDGRLFAGSAPVAELPPEVLSNKYFITRGETRFLTTNRLSESYKLQMVLFTPYTFNTVLSQVMQALLFLVSILMVCMVPISYRFLSASFLKPLDRLNQWIQCVRDGKSVENPREERYRIAEFASINAAFYKMLEEIQNLKIASYEEELYRQRLQMQYLQLQIKPHFFLNCLKNIYSLVELKKYEKIQQMVLLISQYLRNRFKDNSEQITLREEMKNVHNYVELQNLTAAAPVVLWEKSDDGVEDCRIPPLVVQTFVENALKYARQENQTLEVGIRINRLPAEKGEYLDITVSDNGPGFSAESLALLSDGTPDCFSEKHIGIHNVKQRLRLLYGQEATIQCGNGTQGAQCEVVLPLRREGSENL